MDLIIEWAGQDIVEVKPNLQPRLKGNLFLAKICLLAFLCLCYKDRCVGDEFQDKRVILESQ